MKLYPIQNAPAIWSIRQEKTKIPFQWRFLIYLAVFFVYYFLQNLVVVSVILMDCFTDSTMISTMFANDFDLLYEKLLEISQTNLYFFTILFSNIFMIASVLVYTKCIDKRKNESMALNFQSVRPFLIGIGVGLVSAIACTGILMSNKSISIEYNKFQFSFLAISVLAFLIKAVAETLFHNSFLLLELSRVHSPISSIILSSLIFTYFQSTLTGFDFLYFLNSFLFNIILALLTLKFNTILLPLGIRFSFSLFKCFIFGGRDALGNLQTTVFKMELSEAKTLTNGGIFGMEGGIAFTIILTLLSITILLLTQNYEKQNQH